MEFLLLWFIYSFLLLRNQNKVMPRYFAFKIARTFETFHPEVTSCIRLRHLFLVAVICEA